MLTGDQVIRSSPMILVGISFVPSLQVQCSLIIVICMQQQLFYFILLLFVHIHLDTSLSPSISAPVMSQLLPNQRSDLHNSQSRYLDSHHMQAQIRNIKLTANLEVDGAVWDGENELRRWLSEYNGKILYRLLLKSRYVVAQYPICLQKGM